MAEQQASDEPQFADDSSILDNEWLLRGLLGEHVVDGAVSSAAFKLFIPTGPRSHLSVFREAHCDPQRVLKTKLYRSVAFGRLTAKDPRDLHPEVVGVGLVDNEVEHARIIRHLGIDIDSDEWAAVAVLLADACTIAHARM